VQETRLWDEKANKSASMRSKEEAKDYRYFPEPDLPPCIIKKTQIDSIRSTIPELHKEKAQRFVAEFGLSEIDAAQLVFSKPTADFAENMIKAYPQPSKKPVVNWLIGPLSSEANARKCELHEIKVTAENIIELINLVESQQISNLTGKTVLTEMLDTGKTAGAIVKEKNLIQISDESSLEKEIDAVIAENAKVVEEVKAGKNPALMFLVGQAMKRTKGKANPKIVQDILKRRLLNA
jgi:aspartyl-tRNA(Asn)/glutamyl-tRNA(Gln) amidotransferase subunit B